MKRFASFVFAILVLLSSSAAPAQKVGDPAKNGGRGSLKDPVIDSRMTKKEAFDGLDPNCPDNIRKRQRLITVKYYSFDRKVHQGQLVIDKELVRDIETVFKYIIKEHFPVNSVIPISDKRFRKNGRWDDDLSMIADNSSSFNYRPVTGGTRLSNHAYGRAVDINTFQNPYVKGSIILPPGSKYDPTVEGTFAPASPIVKLFLQLGWAWGGNWTSPRDYQHFEKPLEKKSE